MGKTAGSRENQSDNAARNQQLANIGSGATAVPKLAHELRTRLGIIRGAIDNVMDGIFGPVNTEQRKQLQISIDSVERMQGLVEDLMASFTSKGASLRLHPEAIDICSLVENVMENMVPLAFKEGVKLTLDAQSDAITLHCDPARIEQVMINLLRNAVKFTSRGGAVTVKVRETGSAVTVSVVDTGVGIPADRLNTLFSPGYSLSDLKEPDGEFRTSGLGLIIVKEIIDAHGGEIRVKSLIGKGTEFTFVLKKLPSHTPSQADPQ